MYILFATVKVFFAVLPRHRSGLGIRLLSGSVTNTVTARSIYHQAATTICMCVIVAIDLSRVHAT